MYHLFKLEFLIEVGNCQNKYLHCSAVRSWCSSGLVLLQCVWLLPELSPPAATAMLWQAEHKSSACLGEHTLTCRCPWLFTGFPNDATPLNKAGGLVTPSTSEAAVRVLKDSLSLHLLLSLGSLFTCCPCPAGQLAPCCRCLASRFFVLWRSELS